MYEELFVQFEQLRRDRFNNVDNLMSSTRSPDELLADIANIALTLFINSRAQQPTQGFVSNDRRKSD